MPKIIQKVREQLLKEARRQICENGYGATTIRSVAEGCGIGVGTVYNYFQSKDMLIATFMLEDWQIHLTQMKNGNNCDAKSVVKRIYDSLQKYSYEHKALFQDKDAAKVFATVFNERHKLLRQDIADVLLPVCAASNAENKEFLAEFIAESLLVWSIAGKSFEDLFSIVNQLLK